MNEKSIIIFGAGKIGRSFIGQLFGQSGYKITFIDVDKDLVEQLNRNKSYPVVIKGKTEKTIIVKNVHAISGLNFDAVKEEIARTSLMAVSVGKNALEKIIPIIAEGLILRYELYPNHPLDIIIAENMRSAAQFIHNHLIHSLPENFPLEKLVGLVETSIGKMVPMMTKEELSQNPLMIFAEPYNTLILDKKGFKNLIPEVAGLSPKENMRAWVDRKAFIHNMGHAASAYMGTFFHPNANYIYEVLNDKKILIAVRQAMLQAADVLHAYYPNDFSKHDLVAHIDDLLERFQNNALKDTIFRVGQDLPRKLGIDDRFAGIIIMAHQKHLKYDRILNAMSYGFFFCKTNDLGQANPQDVIFLQMLKENGVERTLEMLCGFNAHTHHFLIEELNVQYLKLKKTVPELNL